MISKLQNHKLPTSYEIAISSDDLRMKSYWIIRERQSTAGFEEVSQVRAPNGSVASNRIHQHDQSFYFENNLEVSGPLTCLLQGGYWKINVYLEPIGGGETPDIPAVMIQYLGKSNHRYQTQITIKPYSLKPGIYRVVGCVQYYLKKDQPGPIVGFQDLDLMKIYEDKNNDRPSPQLDDITTLSTERKSQ